MKKEIISPKATRQVFRDYWRQYASMPWSSFIGFAMPAIGMILIFFIPPLIIANMVNLFNEQGRISLAPVVWQIALFGGSWFLGEMCWRLGEHFMTRVKEKGVATLSVTAFERMAERDYVFYTNTFVGSLTKRASSFTHGFETVTEILSYSIFCNVFPLIFATVVLWGYSFWLPAVLFAALGVAVMCAVPLIRKRAVLTDIRHETSSRVMGLLSDAATNMMTVKSFAQEKRELGTYSQAAKDHGVAYRKAADYNNLRISMIISPIYVATNVAGLILAVVSADMLSLSAGAIVIVFSYFSQITRMLWDVNHVYRGFEVATSGAAEFTQMFVEPPLVSDVPNASELKVTDAAITFDNISFGYREGKRGQSFLNGFNLTIEPNQKVGLVGPSGSGKTTITKLILRFLDVNSGAIKIDGQDISKVTQQSLREIIAYVPQEPLLFHRSLLENIAYGNPDATDAEVVKAAKLAHAHEFISRLPKGYHTMVGERGVKLSGGQRQRVAIARALLKKSSILVLDEATSSLDSESEKYIQEGLVELMKEKTALVIAHRLSTIKNLDRILVLERGRIVQDGTHDELIKQEGLYAKLWSHQTGEFLSS